MQRFGCKHEGAAGCKADFWGKWVNEFLRVIPADRHTGAMGRIRRGGLPAGRGNSFRTRPSVGRWEGLEPLHRSWR